MTDYIRREDALKALYNDYAYAAMEVIKRLPAADVAPVVHGRWIPTEYPFMNECEDCSSCGYRTLYGNGYDYCPNCGAKMDGGFDDATS